MRAVLCSVSTDSTFTGRSERSRTALQQTTRLIEKSSDPNYQDNFDNFAVKLVNVLETTFRSSTGYTRSHAVQREKLWKAFHGVRVSKLVDLWKQLLISLEEDLDPLVQQYVNQKLYEDIIKCNFCSYPSPTSKDSSLTPDEENIIRYASGYVPMVLMKKYERVVSEKSASFVECLSAMAVNGEESTILEYTSQWVSKVNRGGLFEVNDMAYLLFREIEINLQDKLTKLLQPSATVQLDRKEELITSTAQDDTVQFYWTMLSADIDGEEESVELLRDIVELWLTIRGFSIAGQWMEIYKKCSSKTTKKSKSLRKTLKQGTGHADE